MSFVKEEEFEGGKRYTDRYGTIYYCTLQSSTSYHRVNGPAIIYPDGTEEWWFNRNIHRDNGPAIIWATYKAWYKHGKLHRLDGPAQEWNSGEKGWRIDGEKIPVKSQEEFERYLKLIVFQ